MSMELLIEKVRQNPCLYDTNSLGYRRAHLKERVWSDIASKLKVDVPFCKSKWRCLRDRNRRELTGLNLPSSKGSSVKKPWQYLEQMSFVKHYQLSRRIRNDESSQQYLKSVVKEKPDPLILPDLTQSPRSPAAILRPRLSSASSSCTSIQGSPQKSSRDNLRTAKETLEKNLSKFLCDASMSLQNMESMEHFMLSIAADVEMFGWSAKKILKYKNKISQLTLEVDAGDSD